MDAMWKGIRVNWVRWKKMFGQHLHVLFGSVGISRDRTMKGESGPHSNRVLCTPNHFKLFIKPPPEPKPFHHLFMNFTINNSWWKIKQTCQAKRNSIMIKKESICFFMSILVLKHVHWFFSVSFLCYCNINSNTHWSLRCNANINSASFYFDV